jgi:ketol-acid reductoisomerase
MKKILGEIQDGTFARNWLLENQVKRPFFNARRRIESESLLETTGKKLRALMSWLKK